MCSDSPHPPVEYLPLGAPVADRWLGGGLKLDGLHEAYAMQAEDSVSALSWASLLARIRQKQGGNSVIWLREARSLARYGVPYAPGLVDMGVDPGSTTLMHLPDGKAVLRAALDSVRDGAAGAVLIELHGPQKLLDLTASRRLALAAKETRTTVLLARSNAQPPPSAAHTRWQVKSAPSLPSKEGAPGQPTFDLALLRHRGGREGLHIILEWDRDTVTFKEPEPKTGSAPLSLPASAVAGSRKSHKGRKRAA